MVLQLRSPLGVDLASVQFNAEDRFDPILLRSLFELDMGHYVPMLCHRKGGSPKFSDSTSMSLGQLKAIKEAVCGVVM